VSGPVLIAYDGSPGSATAIAVAGRLISERRAFVCHAWSGLSRATLHAEPAQLPGALRDAAAQLDQLDLEAAEGVAAEGVRQASAAGFRATPLAVRKRRKTWHALIDAAARNRASLVVTGAHGMSGIGRAVLGSVSTGLVHHAPIPVLVVPSAGGEEGGDGPLLLCYDGSEQSKRTIEAAAEIFGARRAVLLHSWESWVAEAPALAGVSKAVAGMATELDEIADDQSADRCAEGVAMAELAGFEVEGLSERASGPIWMTILEVAERYDCAAIAVGSRGLTGISAALGSVSNGVVHHSRRPVLVVPPSEDER
jgi:nucleotide-binding universal stress UspA family protein